MSEETKQIKSELKQCAKARNVLEIVTQNDKANTHIQKAQNSIEKATTLLEKDLKRAEKE